MKKEKILNEKCPVVTVTVECFPETVNVSTHDQIVGTSIVKSYPCSMKDGQVNSKDLTAYHAALTYAFVTAARSSMDSFNYAVRVKIITEEDRKWMEEKKKKRAERKLLKEVK